MGISHTPRRRRRMTVFSAALLAVALVLAGCGQGSANNDQNRAIIVWTLETQQDRMAVQQQLAQRYTARGGAKVEIRAVDEGQLSTLITAAAAGGTLPDAIFALPLSYTAQLA